MADNDKGTIILIAGVVILYLYLTRAKGTGTTLTKASSCAACTATSCTGCPSAAVNVTTPANPARGRIARLHMQSGGRSANDQAGTVAPGSNWGAPGAGNNWQGLSTGTRTPLTPPPCPVSPISPVGSSANSTVQVVTT